MDNLDETIKQLQMLLLANGKGWGNTRMIIVLTDIQLYQRNCVHGQL
jgi:hypothetical protein